MKRLWFSCLIIFFLTGIIFSFLLFGSATKFDEKQVYVYITNEQNMPVAKQILQQLKENRKVRNSSLFVWIAYQTNSLKRVKPGRFKIEKGQSLFSILRTFRNNKQSEVKLVLNKERTLENIATNIANAFEISPNTVLLFLTNKDSLAKFSVNEFTATTLFIPDTYYLYWTNNVGKIIDRLASEKTAFWQKENRISRAEKLGLTPEQVYTIASIVEEETNYLPEKDTIASVYINRYKKGMNLGADPTVKFALNNFSIKRILFEHLTTTSPYNTYKYKGLPPGPICIPSKKTIDAVLNAASTNYLFFVAKDSFDGTHKFSTNYTEHLQYARAYQEKLNIYMKNKQP